MTGVNSLRQPDRPLRHSIGGSNQWQQYGAASSSPEGEYNSGIKVGQKSFLLQPGGIVDGHNLPIQKRTSVASVVAGSPVDMASYSDGKEMSVLKPKISDLELKMVTSSRDDALISSVERHVLQPVGSARHI